MRPINYRPISLLPILSKVYENVLNYQIRSYLDNNNLIKNRQFGFRSGTATEQICAKFIKLGHS